MDELLIEAKTENIDVVLNFINAHIEDCPVKVQNQIGVVIDEIFSNIVYYAYNPATGSVTVRISADDNITIEFEDGGREYDPLSAKEPDVSLGIDERGTGGLGLFIVKNIMDSVEYRRDGSRNILTIRKKI